MRSPFFETVCGLSTACWSIASAKSNGVGRSVGLPYPKLLDVWQDVSDSLNIWWARGNCAIVLDKRKT